MAINLLGNYNIANNAYNSVTGDGNVGVSGASAGNAAATTVITNSELLNLLKELLPGQTLDGKLVSQDGKALQLLLKDNTLLNTTLDSNTSLAIGQNITFEVKSNTNGHLLLRPLNTNLDASSTVLKALESASVNVSEETIKMVDSLMKEGMSIGRDMLQTINREINTYPNADVNDIVLLHKLDIPVNESNIEQMHLYNNNNQWMTSNIENMSDDMLDLLKSMSDKPDELSELADKLQSLFGDKTTETGEETVVAKDQMTPQNTEEIIKSGAEAGRETVSQDNKSEIPVKQNVFDLIKNLTPEKLTDKELVNTIRRELNEAIGNKMLMEPEQVADKEYVKNYYDKVLDIANNLENFLNQSSKGESNLAKDMSGLKDNVNFMNQMNELYNYVQLPLKMSGNLTKSDLYVYSRKAKKGEKQIDEPLTALLHLSMDYLGNMDIYLKLQQGKLSTDFKLEKEEMIDFIGAHIDELNARLIDKGYNVDTKVGKLEDNNRTVIDTIKGESPQITLLSNQSFDARA